MRASLNFVLITTNQTQAFANRKEAFHLRPWDESSCTVHHTTDKVFEIACELGRELDLLTYGTAGWYT